jgi:hypothetical protein
MLKKVLFYSVFCLFFLSCSEEKRHIDPYWGINLDAKQSVIETFIYHQSSEGLIFKSVFSFEKITYLKNGLFDARINSILYNPVFVRKKLSELKYTLSVDFKNEKIDNGFNIDFYRNFKLKMSEVYGSPKDEIQTDEDIILKWEINNWGIIHIHVIKLLNDYSFSFKKV